MPNKLFFFCNIHPFDQTKGITKKVFAQIRAFENLGFEVAYYTGYTDDGVAVFNRSGEQVYKKKYIFSSKMLQIITRNQELKAVARSFLKESEGVFSICYVRYLFSDPLFIRFLKQAREKSDCVIVEAHSYPIYSKKKVAHYPVYAVDFLWNRQIKKYVDYVFSMDPGYASIWGIKAACIENGVDLDSTSKKGLTYSSDIRLVAIAYEWEVHGFDRLLKGLRKYYDEGGGTKVTLKLVGTVMSSTRNLIKELRLEDYVSLTGKRFGKELDEIYDNSDIGVGSLALHRIGDVTVAKELKTREYIAKGLPYICAGQLNDGEWYNCVFPPDESPIDIKKVVDYYYHIQTIENYTEKIRNEATSMTWTAQFEKAFRMIKNDKSDS